MHTSVTALTTDSGGTGSAVIALSTDSAVTSDVHITVKVVATDSAVSCHRCHTNVYIVISALSVAIAVISALSLPLLSQRGSVLVFAVTALRLVLVVTALCTSASDRRGISPV